MKKKIIEVNNLFVDVRNYFKEGIYFDFFIGGRGIGKTYSMMNFLDKDVEFFIYMRYSKDELEKAIKTDNLENNEFYKINPDFNFKELSSGFYAIYKGDKMCGYATCLQTFYKIRGVNFEKATVLFLDEFIPEINARRVLKDPASALFNAIESINRNREMFGQDPIHVVCCANSNNIYNEIFTALEIVQDLELTIKNGLSIYCDEERLLQVVKLKSKEEFIKQKKETALYRFTKGTKFYKMALENQFAYNDFDFVVRDVSLVGFKPLFQINNIIIWKKKGQEYYLCKYGKKQANLIQLKNDVDKKFINKRYKEKFFTAILNRNMFFDSYEVKKQIFDIFDIKC